ncbi:predicted protein [Uncinocarpus reesii 1704]|uniref:Uncharacterized protein n=1 Tax=Uncinocarpus reesii (strain UAMH 1704) TaxID=336963 RepID=C4K064_UNCRE|nr:uncharacterized protein UREG_07815 [Uncinocarpus reesii 1704]EEP82950.1 predicted protein [Uncinocarpus reesii 1704]
MDETQRIQEAMAVVLSHTNPPCPRKITPKLNPANARKCGFKGTNIYGGDLRTLEANNEGHTPEDVCE